MITLVLGGARSGKSAVAERLVLARTGPLVYLATGTATDADMGARIDDHRSRRDPRFTTIEAGADLARALRDAPDVAALVDALGTWVAAQPAFRSDRPVGSEPDPTAALDELVAALTERRAPTVLVSDEVGLGVHPESEVGRRFRDVLGVVNQRIAGVADDVLLVVAGRVMRLEPAEVIVEGPLAGPPEEALLDWDSP